MTKLITAPEMAPLVQKVKFVANVGYVPGVLTVFRGDTPMVSSIL